MGVLSLAGIGHEGERRYAALLSAVRVLMGTDLLVNGLNWWVAMRSELSPSPRAAWARAYRAALPVVGAVACTFGCVMVGWVAAMIVEHFAHGW
jgi:hypothetical protein